LRNDYYTNGGNSFYVVLYNGINAGSIGNSGSCRYHRFLCCPSKKTEKINSSSSKAPPSTVFDPTVPPHIRKFIPNRYKRT